MTAQGTEDFTNLPTATASSYQSRTWTGTDGVTWTAEGARTDQTIVGRAICFGTSATAVREVISPVYANGMGTLSFDYVRAFTGTGARSLQVWVNGVQIGSTITVSPTSDAVVNYSQAISIGGPVQLEIRSTGASQVKVDNIAWTPFTAGPTLTFSAAAQSVAEGAGVVPVDLVVAPATVTGGTVTIGVTLGPDVVYGAGGDLTTAPAGGGGTISLVLPAGATSASFSVSLQDDAFWEPSKTITFSILGTTGDLVIGLGATHTFTIINDDVIPTAFFGSGSGSHLETAGPVLIPIAITPAATAGSLTLSLTNGPGTVYGADYTTVPDGSGGSITLAVPAGATTVNIAVTLLDDPDIEPTETVTFTLTGTTGGLLIGPGSSFVLGISDDDTPPTVLEPGDLVILAMNANTGACVGPAGADEVSFVCFKDIHAGTTLDLTDNGYSRCYNGLWGNNEGLLRLTRTGPSIPAGTVVTLRWNGSGVVTGVYPDAGWTAVPVGGLLYLNLNSSGDQLFVMQGGTWSDPGVPTHSATYSGGSILYGFSTNGQWLAGMCGSNLHSGLPPQMECFSMEPTSTSDWSKYTGPLTATTQRGWILRIGDPANWTNHANCADFAASAPDYASGMVLPITTGGFTPGLWTGGISTDWFDCKNWDDARVPSSTTDVRIDQTAVRNCVVGLTTGLAPGGTGTCATLLLTSSGGGRTLFLDPNSTLDVGGSFEVERTAGAGVLYAYLFAGATLNAGSIEVGSATADPAGLYMEFTDNTVNVAGDVTLDTGGLIDMQGAGTNGGTLLLQGDYANLAGENRFIETNGRVVFTGGNDQSISTDGTQEVFFRLRMDKSAGDLYLNAPIAVRDELDLTAGRIFSTATELLTARVLSVAVNASDASFVHGPLRKEGVVDYEFPVGKGNSLRPCALVGHTGPAPAAFVAEYFPLSPRTTFNNVLEPTLDHISDCEYWMIDRTQGTTTAFVELTWDTPESCGVDDLPGLRVARWDGTQWLDRGNGMVDGSATAGAVRTSTAQTLFSPWTLASVNGLNPLPISLLEFTAEPDGRAVALRWTTASERDNAYFTVERSRDGLTFDRLLDVPGAGTSFATLHYRASDDQPFSGWNHYRLRQTDLDGTSSLSRVVSVWLSGTGRPLSVFSQAGQLMAWHDFPAGAHYELMDPTGRLITTGNITHEGRTVIGIGDLPAGVYLLRLVDGGRSESVRFVH